MWGSCGGLFPQPGVGQGGELEKLIKKNRGVASGGEFELPISQIPTPFPLSPFWGGGGGVVVNIDRHMHNNSREITSGFHRLYTST